MVGILVVRWVDLKKVGIGVFVGDGVNVIEGLVVGEGDVDGWRGPIRWERSFIAEWNVQFICRDSFSLKIEKGEPPRAYKVSFTTPTAKLNLEVGIEAPIVQLSVSGL